MHPSFRTSSKSCPQAGDKQTNRHKNTQGKTNTLFAGGTMIRIKVTDLVAVLPRKDTPPWSFYCVKKYKIVIFYLKYNCRLEKNSCEKWRTYHLHVGSIQTDLARAWGQRQELDLSYSNGHSAVDFIVAVLYSHIFLTLGGTHDFLNTPKISKGFILHMIFSTSFSISVKSLCPFKPSITKNALLECLKSVAVRIRTANFPILFQIRKKIICACTVDI